MFPIVKPVDEGVQRPFWSVMIPTYNGAKYLEKTLLSVLAQDPGAEVMQIEVVDDCSTEVGIEEIVQEIGQGRVSFYRNSKNLGLIGNWNACIQRARGHWIHILHQDDLVKPNFYAKLQAGIENNTDIGAAFCRHIFMNEEGNKIRSSPLERQTPGIIDNWLERIAVEQLVQCASIVVKRSVYEDVGSYFPEVGYAADWEMYKRIAASYKFWYEPEILACYRWHPLSATSGYIVSGGNIVDTRKAIKISESYLPKSLVKQISRKSKKHYARYAFILADEMLDSGHLKVALTQIREGLKCSQSPRIIASLGKRLIYRIIKRLSFRLS